MALCATHFALRVHRSRAIAAAYVHTMPAHLCPDGHACPHMPQLLSSKLTSWQAPPQSLKPVKQSHIELMQRWPAIQMLLHAPQFAESLARLTHAPPGHVV
jgi:hypothetical protein